MKINILSASGKLGKKVMNSFLDQGASPDDLIASVRTPSKVEDMKDKGIDVREADYDKPDLLSSAFKDTDVLLIIPSIAPLDARKIQLDNALEAAKDAGVKRVILSSIATVKSDSVSQVAPFYQYAESKVKESGIDWTILRNNLYIEPVAEWVPELIEMGKLPYPVKSGRVAYVTRDDLAAAMAGACLSEEHSKKIYELSGSKAISMPELAGYLSKATGKDIPFYSATDEEYIEICNTGKEEVPEHVAKILVSLYWAVDNNEFSNETNHIELLSGKPPEPVEDYLMRVLKDK